MGLFSRNKPKIKITTTKKDGFSGWLKCTHCNELIHANELEGNLNCCPKCDYHYRLSAEDRIRLLADPDTFVEKFAGLEAQDALGFIDSQPYHERIRKRKNKSGREEASGGSATRSSSHTSWTSSSVAATT